jgi:hypothetical protein
MNDSTRKPGREEFRGENHDASHSETETESVHTLTQKAKTWDTIQNHPIAQKFDAETQLALVSEFIDLREDLQGMSLAEFIDSYFAADDGGAEAPAEAADEVEPEAANDTTEPSDHGDGDSPEIKRPASMVGMRVVHRSSVGIHILSDANGVTRDSDRTLRVACEDGVTRDIGTVAFTGVDGEALSNVLRTEVYPVYPENYREIHIAPREAKEIEGWLAGNPAKNQPEGALLRCMFVEFQEHPDRIAFAIMNHKKPYVDRFVALPNYGFEDGHKPTRRLFGEHGFVVRGKAYIVNVVSP